MEDFGVIESGFSNADETINFGTRAIGYDCLYEISTIACLKCSEDNSGIENVVINSLVKNGKVFITTNKSIKIFEDTELSAIIFNAVFDTVIDTICVSPNGNFLLICLKSGMIHIFNIEDTSESKCLFKKSIVQNDWCETLFVGSYIEHFTTKFCSFIIVSSSGKVYRVCIHLKSASDENRSSMAINSEEIHDFNSKINISSFYYPLLLVQGAEVSILNIESKIVISDDIPCNLKSVYSLGHKFLGLDMEGYLHRICTLTLLVFPVEQIDTLFEDIATMDDINGNTQVVAVTKKNEQGESFLQLLNSDFSSAFSLKLSHCVHLIQPESSSDETLIISKISNNGFISELRIQCVYETEPELRLTRLIKKQRFEEAEKFAKNFNINPAVILQARAQVYMDMSVCSSEDIINLMNILESIDDDYFKLQCCSNVECSSAEDVRKILNYGSTIKPKSHNTNKEAVLLLQQVLMDSLFKFDTYMEVNSVYDTQTWSRFSTCDLIEEMKILLKNFQIEEAIIICSRLDLDSLKKLTEDKVEEILSVLNNLPTTLSQAFLPTFVPVTMANTPSALSVFVGWLRNKVFQLEKRDSFNFPHNAIQFVEFILKLLKVRDSSGVFFQRQCTLDREDLNAIAALMDALRGLQRLKTEFRIHISLSEYLEGPKTVIRTLLNVVMAPEDYDYFLKEFLYKFMIQNQFEPDQIFLDEIRNLIQYDEVCWVKIVETILKYISAVGVKLEAIKEILENAQVPWCDTVRNIGRSALQYLHPSVAGIKEILENEPRMVVLRNSKYKIKEKHISSISDLQYFVNRIVYISEPSMKDDVYRLCKTAEDRHEVNIILIQNFIKKSKFEEAMSVLDNNDKEEIYSCSKWFFTYAEIAINNKVVLNKQRDSYYTLLGSIFRRLVDNSDNSVYKRNFEDDVRTLRGVYNINKIFQRNITSADIRLPIRKKKLLDELIEETVNNFDRGTSDIPHIMSLCDKLAFYLFLNKDDILIKFCQKIGKFEVILKVGEHLYNSETHSRNLCLIAVLLLKYVAACDTQLPIDSLSDSSDGFLLAGNSSDSSLNSGDSSNNILVGLKLCEKIISKALVNAEEEELSAIVEVMNWANSCFYLTRYQENPLQVELFKNLYHSEHTVPGYPAFAAIRNTFNTYCSFVGKFENPNTKYLTYFNRDIPPLTEEQLLQEISSLPESVDSLCREGQHLTAYKLIITLENGLRYAKNLDAAVLQLLSSIFTKKCLPQLIHVVVSSKHIDLFLFQNLLLASNKDYYKYIEHYLKLYKRQPRKLQDIATVGIKLLDHYQVSAGREVLVNAVITCKWWNKLKAAISNTIPYDVFFKENSNIRLKQLISLSVVDVNLIKEYCDDYKLDLQTYYMEYLRSTFVNWKPCYDVKTDMDGKKNLIIKNDENSLHTKCQEIISVIEDKEAAFTLMSKIWDVANFYHYEVFLCIVKILSNNGKADASRHQDMSMLVFLKSYQRFSTPSQSEKEQWYSTFPESQMLDPLSEFRLPFIRTLFTYDIWNIIRPEINLKSYRCWFGAINILQKNLKKDDICIYAVKEVVSSGILGEEVPGSWILYPKFEELFSEVDECVQHISDLERATSVIYHLMYHTPNGADKVNAAQLSYKYAKKYKERNPNSRDVEKAYIKVKTKYYSFSAIHILHTFQLAEEKYVQLVAQPEDLIDALYLDERILKQAESINLSCPDINKAVYALGELFDLNIEQIRYNLLNRWLNSSNIDVDLDSTVVAPNIKASASTDDNLKRAMYICTNGDKSFWQPYLLKVGLHEDDREDSEQKSPAFKAKALKCFCAISDVETITRLTDVTYKEFLYYIDKLSLLNELECLGIALNIVTLDQYNKKDLLKRLSQIGKPVAIKVMATICMTYVIEDLRYWEFIINNTVKLGMFTELKTYVDYLKNKCYKNFYINAWQVIVDNAFNLPVTLSREELDEVYVTNFLMIQSCPVLHSLNFEKILLKCIKTEKFEFAAVLLHYLPEKKKEIYVNEIVQCKTLLLDLDNLSKRGVCGIRRIKAWLATKELQ